jgi:transcriptional regulator
MYVPSHFAVTDRKTQLELIDRYSFGTLTTVSAGRARISTIPFLLGHDGASLDGHVARANTHWQDFADATDVLLGFVGPNAYVSPTWYRSANMVPTWNYVAVEVRGRIELLDDLAARLDVVDRLSAKFEAHLPTPWHSAKMDAQFREKLLGAIVAFRVHIESIEAKAKLSQNRKPEDRLSAAVALELSRAPSNEQQLAALMRDALG